MKLSLKRLFLAHLLLFVFVVRLPGQEMSQQGRDSLEKIIKTGTDNKQKVMAMAKLAFEIKYENPDYTRQLCENVIKSGGELAMYIEVATAHKILGILADEKGNYSESIKQYMLSLENYKHTSDSIGVARTEGNIAMLYTKLGQPKESLRYFLSCLPVFERNNFVMGINLASQNIGIAYYDQGQFDSALKYFQKALHVLDKHNQKDPSLYGNLANAYDHLGNKSKQLFYLDECIKTFEAKGDSTDNYFFWVFNYGREIMGRGNVEKGSVLIERGISGFKRKGSISSRMGISMLHGAAMDYSAAKMYKEAHKYEAMAFNLQSKLFSEDFSKQISEMKEKYDSDKKELNIANLKKEQDVQQALIKQKTTQQYAMAGGLALTLLSLSLVYRNFRQKKKDNLIIQQQKDLVEQKNKEITDSIIYASRIQRAHIPSENNVSKMMMNTKAGALR